MTIRRIPLPTEGVRMLSSEACKAERDHMCSVTIGYRGLT